MEEGFYYSFLSLSLVWMELKALGIVFITQTSLAKIRTSLTYLHLGESNWKLVTTLAQVQNHFLLE